MGQSSNRFSSEAKVAWVSGAIFPVRWFARIGGFFRSVIPTNEVDQTKKNAVQQYD